VGKIGLGIVRIGLVVILIGIYKKEKKGIGCSNKVKRNKERGRGDMKGKRKQE